MTRLPIVVLIFLVLALAGCGSDTSTSSNSGGLSPSSSPSPVAGTSGVQGQVTRGPLSPVTQANVTNTAPLAGAVVLAQRPDGSEAGRQTSDANGNYQIVLAPGTYSVVGLPTGNGQFPTPPAAQTATVTANQFTTVNLGYDTGIR